MNRLRDTLTLLGVACSLVVMLASCVETRVVKSSWDNLESLSDPKPDEAQRRDPNAPRLYAVELQRFEGEGQLNEAFMFARKVRESAEIADVWFSSRENYTGVYVGRYPAPDTEEAEASLKRVRRAFRDAKLVPVERSRSSGDPHDLAQYSGYRSLLLAVYDEKFGPDFRRAAERTAEDYRKQHEGTSVYYYHGPSQSIVTAGLFTEMDFVMISNVESYGPTIKTLQQTFPHVLRNGSTFENAEIKGEDKREPTIIIRVP